MASFLSPAVAARSAALCCLISRPVRSQAFSGRATGAFLAPFAGAGARNFHGKSSPQPRSQNSPTAPFFRSASSARAMSSSPAAADLLCVHVFVTVKPGTESAFLEASLANARASSAEEGIARFDVVQQADEPTKFVLVEVYRNADAPAAHKATEHYAIWRKAVADMMAEPRSAIKYNNRFPATDAGWNYGSSALE